MSELDNMCPPSPLAPRESSKAGQADRYVVPPKVVSLRWEELHTDRGDGTTEVTGWEAPTGFSAWYTVEQYFGSDSFGWVLSFDGVERSDHDEPDKAKAEAQADFEKRILKALECVSDENRNGEDPEGLRSEGLPARCHEVTDALTLSPKEQKGE